MADPTIGQRITAARLTLGLTQQQAAEIMGVTRPQVANIEADRSDIPATKALLLLDRAQTPPRHELRDRVFTAIVKERDRNPTFATVMDQLGFFTACDFIDGIVNAITTASTPPPAPPDVTPPCPHGVDAGLPCPNQDCDGYGLGDLT